MQPPPRSSSLPAKDQGSFVVPVHQFLFQPGVQRLLSGGKRYGELVRCVFEAATVGAESTGLDRDEVVAEILPHPLALFSRLLSADLAEAEWVVVRPAAGELRALASAGRTTCEIGISTRGPTHAGDARRHGHESIGARRSVPRFRGRRTGLWDGVRKVARPFSLAGSTLGRAGANLTRRALSRETAYPGLRELVRRTYASIATAISRRRSTTDETMAVAVARDAILAAGEPSR